MPQVHEIDGVPTWTMDGKVLARGGASGVVGADGVKVPGTGFFPWNIEDVHAAAYDVDARLALMDEQGIWAQIVYPNTVGFGGQRFSDIGDDDAPAPVGRALQRRHGRAPGAIGRSGCSRWASCRGGTSTSR